jgi:hypothetical protein
MQATSPDRAKSPGPHQIPPPAEPMFRFLTNRVTRRSLGLEKVRQPTYLVAACSSVHSSGVIVVTTSVPRANISASQAISFELKVSATEMYTESAPLRRWSLATCTARWARGRSSGINFSRGKVSTNETSSSASLASAVGLAMAAAHSGRSRVGQNKSQRCALTCYRNWWLAG